jgi:hypothetical protein
MMISQATLSKSRNEIQADNEPMRLRRWFQQYMAERERQEAAALEASQHFPQS